MRRLSLAAWFLLGGVACLAQTIRVPPYRTVAQLGACGTGSPKIVAVVDALAVTDCSIGGGVTDAMCMCRNGAWTPFGNAGSGTVTSVGFTLSGLPWLTVSGPPVTSAGTIAVSLAPGQTPGLVWGTCGTSTTLGLCALTAGMIPGLDYLSASTSYAGSATPGGAASSVATGSITNASVSASAAIAESKLALAHPTHDNGNDPTAGQKAALVGTFGPPATLNPYVTDADPRNTNARTPVSHVHAAGDITSGVFDPARLATGIPTALTFPAGDGTWKVPPTPIIPGVGFELLYRGSSSTLAAVAGSSVSGGVPAFASSVNVGGFTSGDTKLKSTHDGYLLMRTGDDSGYIPAVIGGSYTAVIGGTPAVRIGIDGMELRSGQQVAFSSNGSDATQGKDSGLKRDGAGVLKVTDGSAGNGSLKSLTVQYIPTSGVPCNSGVKGLTYVASGDGTFCSCNGAAWNPSPSTGTCN